MTYEEALGRLEDAKLALSLATERLQTAHRGVLSGAYKPRELGEALAAYRHLKKKWQTCKAEMERLIAVQGTQASGQEESPLFPGFVPTPKMLFARWLYQAGRLTDE